MFNPNSIKTLLQLRKQVNNTATADDDEDDETEEEVKKEDSNQIDFNVLTEKIEAGGSNQDTKKRMNQTSAGFFFSPKSSK
jgi:hypothetical protein